ncbi:conserved hypothetical protein [Verticillium alfalfae VaMs.102]|uniref:Geranylgeranyl pyrophosphate synthetase n=1 Tax=Verticillium alfalfae (strain VaMs.102 / ATCC MYA-4576 / FGSC 10136) TaxID=526221 RepID=C9SVX5_VERA1|nr:conserved hypothetical protein [Verticillium alfalfae VaMs.102]EEY22940.1 conserved hypothetical protein [Verticillium alfalfae VaMs.102]
MPLASPTPSYPPLPLGPEIACISVAKLAKDDAIPVEKARVSACQLVASYNWLDKPKPTIITPGLPPRWNPPSEPPQLKEDSGVFYRDRNASRLPLHPMEPAIESILLTRPSFAVVSSTPIDIVACGSTLGNLLRFTSGDGYLSALAGEAAATRAGPASLAAEESTTVASGHSPVEDLAASLSAEAISPAIPVDGPLTVKSAGRAIPQRALFDLKTRSIKSIDVDHLAKELPRLYLSQTPNFILAHHMSGVFKKITIFDVRSRLSEWEAASAEPLGLLTVLLRRVLVLARERHDGRLELTRGEGETAIHVREQTPGLPGVLSSGCEARWKAWLAGDGDDSGIEKKDNAHGADDEEVDLSWVENDDDFTACTESCGYCGYCTY